MATQLDLATSPAKSGCGCGCGTDDAATPEFAASTLPKIVRHGAIIGGLTSMKPGQKVVISFGHDPLPLLTQLNRVAPDAVALDYIERGPESWRIEFTRQ